MHAVDASDRDGAWLVPTAIAERFPALRYLWVDAGYAGQSVAWIEQNLWLSITVVCKPRRGLRWPADQTPPPAPGGFRVMPGRWVVERTFAWLERSRRPNQRDEALPETGEVWVRLAMSGLMLARLDG